MSFSRVFILLFIFISCENRMLTRFENNIYKRWFSAKEINLIQKKYFNNEENLKRPINTTQLFFSILTEKNQRDCFYYKIPGAVGRGEIFIKEVTAESECPSFPNRPYRWNIKDIDLRIISISEKENSLTFYYKSQLFEDEIKIVFFNFKLKIKQDERTLKFKKYSTSAKIGKELGLTVWKSNKNILKLRKENPYKSMPEMFYQAIKCHNINEDCEEVTENQCNKCTHGYFEVVGGLCPNGNMKFCGPNKCGEKAWPACPRGKQYEKNISRYKCVDEKGGFCRKGLKAICNSEGILICL